MNLILFSILIIFAGVSAEKFRYRCYEDVCTYPTTFCNANEKRCSHCRYGCMDEVIPPACSRYCKRQQRQELKRERKMKEDQILAVEPAYCPKDSVVVRVQQKDVCVPCPEGLNRLSNSSSFRIDKGACYDYRDGECAMGDLVPTSSIYSYSCAMKCECDINRCYYGNPCTCLTAPPCEENQELDTKTGKCVPCKDGFVKPETGCHPCIPVMDSMAYFRPAKLLKILNATITYFKPKKIEDNSILSQGYLVIVHN